MSNRTVYYGGSPGPPRNEARFSVPSHQQSYGHISPGDGHTYNGPPEMSGQEPLYYTPAPGENVIPGNFADMGHMGMNSYPYGAPMDSFYYVGAAPYYYPQHNNPHVGGNFMNPAPGSYGYTGPPNQLQDYAEWSSNDYSPQLEKIPGDSNTIGEPNSIPEARPSSNESVGKSRRFSRQRNAKENTDGGNKYQMRNSNQFHSQNVYKPEIRFSHQKYSRNRNSQEINDRGKTEIQDNKKEKDVTSAKNEGDTRFSIIRSIGKREVDSGFNHTNDNSKVESKPKKQVQKPKQYKAARSGGSDTQIGVLLEQLTTGTYECMVCCDRVKQQHAIWNCGKCYHVFHMGCIKKWARSPAARVEDEGWRCPGCQNVTKRYPNIYFCYCEKIKEPEWNRRETPHSCGEVCGKKRSNSETCTHPCNILCHPGPCPPCPASVIKNCLCGKMTRKIRCNQQKPLTCSEPCGKKKNCRLHTCDAICHDGDCNLCDVLVAQSCFCGQSGRNITCGAEDAHVGPVSGSDGVYSCENKCDKLLACENHRCQGICHSEECKFCPLLPSSVTTCPCTQSKLSDISDADGNSCKRTSCTDPIPICDKVCGKPLKCGGEDIHMCQLKCHQGPCLPCVDRESTVKCRCGKSEKEVPCTEMKVEPYTCDRRCNKKRKCGRHKCGKTCCTDTDHICSQPCARKLECKLHRCEETCHRGNCHTCYNVSFEELTCQCGAEVLYPPIPCGTKPPECLRSCIRQHPCIHPVKHNCHTEEKCPPCVVLVKKKCNCGRLIRSNIPCHQENVSCGAPCQKPLHCGHKCPKPCHQGPCMTEEDKCNQPCSIMRVECIHPCANPCHHGNSCPSIPCKAMVTLKCNCGSLEKQVECSAGGATYQRLSSEAFARQQQMSASNSVDISTLFQGAGKQKILPCNEECSIKERNRRLAEALNIDEKDSGALDHPQYSPFLQNAVKQDVVFVRNIEQELTNLVEAVEWLDKSKRNHTFPSMKREKRQIVHELAEVFHCKSLSCDEEPNRSVMVTAVRGISKVPRVPPSESVKKLPDSNTKRGSDFQTLLSSKPSDGSKRLLSSMKLVSLTSKSPSEERNKTSDIDMASKRPASIPRMPSYPSASKPLSSGKPYTNTAGDYHNRNEYKNGVGLDQGSKNFTRPNPSKPESNPYQHQLPSRSSSKTPSASKKSSVEPEIDYFDMTG